MSTCSLPGASAAPASCRPGSSRASAPPHPPGGAGTRPAAELAALKRRYGLDLPLHRQYLKWAGRALAGDFGRSMDWRKPVSELIADRMLLTVIMNAAAMVFIYVVAIPNRDLSRHPPVLGRRPCADGGQPDRAGDAAVPAGAGADGVHGAQLRRQRGRPVLARVRRRRLECGQGDRPAGAPAGAGDHHRPVRNRGPDPGDAQRGARRAEEAVRGDRPCQGRHRTRPAVQVPGAGGDQPDHQHGRLDAAGHHLGRDDHGGGAQPAHGGPDAAARPAQPGHIPQAAPSSCCSAS